MSDISVRRLTGGFGLAAGILIVVALALYVGAGTPPPPGDNAKTIDFVTRNKDLLFGGSITDTLNAACFLVFVAGFRHLIRQARPDFEWVATLVFGAGVAYVGVTFTFDMLIGGAALDTTVTPDASAIRALGEGSMLALGSVGLVSAALFLGSAGLAITRSFVLPAWIGWLGYVGAILNLVAVPTIYGGIDATAFYSVNGYAPLVLGTLPFLIWLLAAGTTLLVARGHAASRENDSG